jgi:hypothetical protein
VPDLVYWLRVYVLIVAVVVAVVGTLQWRRWSGFKVENRLAWLALVALNLALGFGTLETLQQNLPGGLRNYIVALAMTFLLAAVLYHPACAVRARLRHRHRHRHRHRKE